MVFIEPLNLEVWLLQIFAGNPEIFAAIALLVIVSMAAMFRMNVMGMFFIIGMFLLMFAGFIDSVLLTFMLVIGALILGYTFWKIFGQ